MIQMLKTLIVEDNAAFRQTTKEMLLSKFPRMTIAEAPNGEEALKEVNRECPNIILMDIKLPGKNGLQMTKEIKALHPTVPIIILTSYDFPEYREVATRYGADYFLVKGTAKAHEILASIDAIFSERQDSTVREEKETP